VRIRDAIERQALGDTWVERPGLQARRDVDCRFVVRFLGQVVGTDQSDRHVLEEQSPKRQLGFSLGVRGVGGYRPELRDRLRVQGQVPPEGDLHDAIHPCPPP
jgi:hypothetical protein